MTFRFDATQKLPSINIDVAVVSLWTSRRSEGDQDVDGRRQNKMQSAASRQETPDWLQPCALRGGKRWEEWEGQEVWPLTDGVGLLQRLQEPLR